MLGDRFWAKVAVPEDDGCWLWIAGINNQGYGMFAVRDGERKTMKLAHRVSYEAENGPIPEGAHICHRCDEPRCVNPSHLFSGSRHDNMRDASQKRRFPSQHKTHCAYGHEFTHGNTYLYPSGLRGCRECRNRWARAYTKENPEKVRATNERYRAQKRGPR